MNGARFDPKCETRAPRTAGSEGSGWERTTLRRAARVSLSERGPRMGRRGRRACLQRPGGRERLGEGTAGAKALKPEAVWQVGARVGEAKESAGPGRGGGGPGGAPRSQGARPLYARRGAGMGALSQGNDGIWFTLHFSMATCSE